MWREDLRRGNTKRRYILNWYAPTPASLCEVRVVPLRWREVFQAPEGVFPSMVVSWLTDGQQLSRPFVVGPTGEWLRPLRTAWVQQDRSQGKKSSSLLAVHVLSRFAVVQASDF